MIKENELDVAKIVFEFLSKKKFKFSCFILLSDSFFYNTSITIVFWDIIPSGIDIG